MPPLDAASLVVVAGSVLGLAGAAVFGFVRRGRGRGLSPRTALARAASYAGLALLMLAAARTGTVGVAVLFFVLGAAALVEWGRLFDLPVHHRIALVIGHGAVIAAVAWSGLASTPALVAGLVLIGVAWPVVRVDTDRAVRDLGYAAVGAVIITVLLAHGVMLVYNYADAGAALVLALAVGCAGSDVGAFVVGRSFGRHPLAPRISPAKTREGVIGNILGAAVGLIAFAPALTPFLGWPLFAALVPLVAASAIWGDLLESAAKREAGVKDAGSWLPGFGGILDRIDSLLVTLALSYWLVDLAGITR